MPDQTVSKSNGQSHEQPSGAEQPKRRWLRTWTLTNLWTTLAGLLGVMQALMVHWWLVVVLGDEGLGAAEGAALGAVLLGANVVSIPVLRRVRRGGGRGRLAARLYLAIGIFTLLVGLAVALSWIGLFPLAQVVGWLGLGAENAFLSFRVVSALFVFAVLGMRSGRSPAGRSSSTARASRCRFADCIRTIAGCRSVT